MLRIRCGGSPKGHCRGVEGTGSTALLFMLFSGATVLCAHPRIFGEKHDLSRFWVIFNMTMEVRQRAHHVPKKRNPPKALAKP